MSAQITEIKKKISSVKNTKKITKAMQLEASSKMKQFQNRAISSREFAWSLLDILSMNINLSESQNLFTEKRTEGKILFIIYTSDKGLCGGLNTRLLKTLFGSKLWTETKKEDRLLMTIGKKSTEFANYNKIPVEKSFISLSEKITPLEVIKIVDQIFEYWISGEVKEVHMIAPHYKNTLIFYPVMKTYLPFSSSMISEHIDIEKLDVKSEDLERSVGLQTIYEPDQNTFEENLIQQIIQSLFLQSFLELKAAEYSSRMISMQNATDAAGEMIDELTLVFNKERQAAITQEIAEIIGGSIN